MGSLPDIAFSVRPYDDRPDYFAVHVAPSREAMLDAMRVAGCVTPDDVVACCVASSCAEFPALRGVLFFSQDDIGGGIVAHEMGHAAFRTMDAAHVSVTHGVAGAFDAPFTTHPTEEFYCRTLERLTREFWREYSDRRLGAPHE